MNDRLIQLEAQVARLRRRGQVAFGVAVAALCAALALGHADTGGAVAAPSSTVQGPFRVVDAAGTLLAEIGPAPGGGAWLKLQHGGATGAWLRLDESGGQFVLKDGSAASKAQLVAGAGSLLVATRGGGGVVLGPERQAREPSIEFYNSSHRLRADLGIENGRGYLDLMDSARGRLTAWMEAKPRGEVCARGGEGMVNCLPYKPGP